MSWAQRRYVVALIIAVAGLMFLITDPHWLAALGGFGVGVAVTTMLAVWTED